MSSELVIAVVCAFLAGFWIASVFYIWWRLGRISEGLYRVGWDLDVLLRRLQKREDHEAPEHSNH
jgi:hypothetical protein